jgi:hypothetical protein
LSPEVKEELSGDSSNIKVKAGRFCSDTGRVRFRWRGRRLTATKSRSSTPSETKPPPKMHFESMPAEIVSHIFLSLPDVSSVVALSETCHYLHDVYHKQRLAILAQAADAQFGPIEEIKQIITHNDSQPAHIQRDVPLSLALMKSIFKVGRIAQR